MAFELHRGTNISHWLSQSPARGRDRVRWFAPSDVRSIAEWGFDHIRLPVDEEQLWDEEGARSPEAFDLLGAAIDWCETEDLRVVVDLHILRSHYFNDGGVPALFSDPAERERFASLWSDLSDYLRSTSADQVAYELLNEAVAPSAEAWNNTWRAAFDAVREREPVRTIVLGSNNFNQYQTYPDLEVPDDEHLVLTFHYYNPMFITHYTAPWWRDGGEYHGPIQYPGQPIPESEVEMRKRLEASGHTEENRPFDREAMLADMRIPAKIAAKHNAPLYCGEFGCYHKTPHEIRRAWYTDIRACFEELGIAWANWDYKGNFGLFSEGEMTPVLDWLLG